MTGVNAGASLTYAAASAASKQARVGERRTITVTEALKRVSTLPRPEHPVLAFRCRNPSCAVIVFAERRRSDAEHLCASRPAVPVEIAAQSIRAAWRLDEPETDPVVVETLERVREGVAPLSPEQQRIERRLKLGRVELTDTTQLEPLGEMFSPGHVFNAALGSPATRELLVRGDWDGTSGGDKAPIFRSEQLNAGLVVAAIANLVEARGISVEAGQRQRLGFAVYRRLKVDARPVAQTLVESQVVAQIALRLSRGDSADLEQTFVALKEPTFKFEPWHGGRQPGGAHLTKVRPRIGLEAWS